VLIPRPSPGRRAIAVAGVLAVAVLGGGAGIAAAGSGAPKGDAAANAAAKATPSADKPQPDPGVPPGLLAETQRALGGLVSDGAISQAQADAVQSRVASGSVDTTEVIASGVLDEAQMQRVDEVLRAIKLSFAGP
jgi:hypothetical protein